MYTGEEGGGTTTSPPRIPAKKPRREVIWIKVSFLVLLHDRED
jgi:hypothetical protein